MSKKTAPTKLPAKARTQFVKDALRKAYQTQNTGILFEVPEGTGWEGGKQRIDAISMGLWPSRGLQLQGFEIKVSRSDWKHELKQPQKAERIFRYCDWWYLVTPAPELGERVVFEENNEIPAAWGWIEVTSCGKLNIKKEPDQHTAHHQPAALDRPFLAALFRAMGKVVADVQGGVDQSVVDALVEARTATAHADIESTIEWRVNHEVEKIRNEYQALEVLKKAFEDAKIPIVGTYSGGKPNQKVLQAVRAIQKSGGLDGVHSGLPRLEKDLEALLVRIRKGMDELGLETVDDRKRAEGKLL